MQKRKFDELISHFNRKVSDMDIDQKYKMELLGMISAIGFAHKKELSTDLASLGTDCISREQAIDALRDYLVGKRCPDDGTLTCRLIENEVINKLPPAEPKKRGMNIEQEKMIVESLPSLYPMQKFEEDAIETVLDALPSAEPKRGRWIGKYPVSSICSECGYLINDSKVKVFAFCPNCGAKMEVTT